MATIAERRAELVAALAADGVSATTVLGKRPPPYAAVIADGITSDWIVNGQPLADFRIALVAGAYDDEAAVDALDALKQTVMATLRALVGWQLGELRRDGIRQIGADRLITADVVASARIAI